MGNISDWKGHKNDPRYGANAPAIGRGHSVGAKGPQARGATVKRGRTEVDDGHQGCNLKSYTARRAVHGK
jgi:hypothetical protein